MISVVMSVYNEKIQWIREAIDSITNQTLNDFELIIIVDNPDAEEIKNSLVSYAESDNRIVLIFNKKNMGLAMSLNEGIKVAHGEYIARMDSDDVAMPDRLQIEKDYLDKNREIALVGSNVDYINEYGNLLSVNSPFVTAESNIKKALLYSNVFKHPTIMFRAEAIKSVGGYNNINPAQDYELITRMILRGYRVSNINTITLHYRMRSNSISNKNALMQMINAEYIKQNYKNRTFYSEETYRMFKSKKLISEKKFEKSQAYLNKALALDKKSSKVHYYLYITLACLLSNFRRRKFKSDRAVLKIANEERNNPT